MLRKPALVAVAALVLLSSAAWSATDISGTISTDVDWTIYGSPYRLVGNVTIPSGVTVTVRPGVQVVAPGPYTLSVLGKLRAFGTQYRPVVFKSTRPTSPGSWGGITLAAGGVGWFAYTSFWAGTNCVTVAGGWAKFERCWFLYAGQDGLQVYDEATVHVQDSTFAYNQRRGLYVETPKPAGSIENCVFMRNGEYPAYLKANCVDMLRSRLRFYDNGIQNLGVSCSAASDITGAKTWWGQPVDFDLTAGSSDTLVIAAGASLTLKPGCRLLAERIQVYGQLISGAAGQAPVVIRGPQEIPGGWPGIFLFPQSTAEMVNTIVRLAETGFTVDDATLTFHQGVLRDCKYDGVYATGVSGVSIEGSGFYNNGRNALRLSGLNLRGGVDGCLFSGSGDYPVFAVAKHVQMLGPDNKYLANVRQAVGVACNLEPDLASAQLWEAQGVPYDLTARPQGTVLHIGAQATLILQPGVAIAGGGVDVSGTLQALGTSTEPIVFTSAGAPGNPWSGLKLYSGSSSNFRHCIIEYAGTGVHMQNVSPRLESCTVRYCSDHGLYIAGTSQPVIYDCHIVSNSGDGVRIVDQAEPNLGNLATGTSSDDGHNVFDHNDGYDICNQSSQNIRAQSNWWATADFDFIAQRIFDVNDAAGRGLVIFSPIISPHSNAAPVLTWADLPGTFHDGVTPDVAAPFVYVDFRVKYADAGGEPPSYVYLHLLKGDTELADSPHRMAILSGTATDYQAGVIHHVGLRLPAGRDYSYYFEASDGLQLASGEPTLTKDGPIITAAASAHAGLLGSVIAQQAPAGNIEIRCQMLAAGHVAVDVLNIAGRVIATVVTDRPLEPGINILLWNGRSRTGTKVPPGRYLVRITATSQAGPRQQMIVPLWVGR